MSRYIDEYRGRFGVEPICRTLDVSASAYYQRASGHRSRRAVEDERLLERIRVLHAANYYAYGSRRMWRALRRAGEGGLTRGLATRGAASELDRADCNPRGCVGSQAMASSASTALVLLREKR